MCRPQGLLHICSSHIFNVSVRANFTLWISCCVVSVLSAVALVSVLSAAALKGMPRDGYARPCGGQCHVRAYNGNYISAILGGTVQLYLCLSRVRCRRRQGKDALGKGKLTTRKYVQLVTRGDIYST